MVTADHDGGAELARAHHFIESKTKPVPVAEADPADAGRQALEPDVLARLVQPIVQERIIRKQFAYLGVGPVDVLGIA